MELLEGAGVQIIVGVADGSTYNRTKHRTYVLSAALLSHHSPILKVECERIAGDPSASHIAFPEVEPAVFALFVEWMYLGQEVPPCTYAEYTASPHALSWILGDKLQCMEFQNHAMARLYADHVTRSDRKPVMPADVAVALKYKHTDTQLWSFYMCRIASHLNNEDLMSGTMVEWDTVIEDHAPVRRAVLFGLRLPADYMHPKEFYMLKKKEKPVESAAASIPTKRDVDGMPVQKELAAVPQNMPGDAAPTITSEGFKASVSQPAWQPVHHALGWTSQVWASRAVKEGGGGEKTKSLTSVDETTIPQAVEKDTAMKREPDDA